MRATPSLIVCAGWVALASTGQSIPASAQTTDDEIAQRIAHMNVAPEYVEIVRPVLTKYPLSPTLRMGVGFERLKSTKSRISPDNPTDLAYCFAVINTGFVAMGAPGSLAAEPREVMYAKLEQKTASKTEADVLAAEARAIFRRFNANLDSPLVLMLSDEPGMPDINKLRRLDKLATNVAEDCRDIVEKAS